MIDDNIDKFQAARGPASPACNWDAKSLKMSRVYEDIKSVYSALVITHVLFIYLNVTESLEQLARLFKVVRDR